MTRNEKQTCRDLIEPAVASAGWSWDAQVEIGPGPVNLTGEAMYDPSQRIVADYLLRLWRMPLAALEAKPEGEPASNGMQQASRYARRLGLRFSIASNGREYILTDNRTGKYERFETPPSPGDLLKLWIGKGTRKDLRAELKDRDVHVAAFRHFFDLDAADDVDILAKVGFDLVRVPARSDRVARFWDREDQWLVSHVGEQAADDADRFKTEFWRTSLDHYGLYGIDDLEQGATYSATAVRDPVRELRLAAQALRGRRNVEVGSRSGEAAPLRADGRVRGRTE